MTKSIILTLAAVIGVALGLYFGLPSDESPVQPTRDYAQVEPMREGDMLKLQLAVNRGSVVPFIHEDGTEMTLADYQGQYVLLNFWATWCAPCRKEMPHLSEVQAEMGGDGFQVVTVATGSNQRPAMERFLEEIGVDNLPLHTDNNSALARDMGVIGLPVTILLDPQGFEIARLIGDADWASDSAKGILRTLMAQD